MDSPAIGIIGAGTLGRALALCLKAHGCNVEMVSSHSAGSAEALAALLEGCRWASSPQEAADGSDVVFITTPDSAIDQVAGQVRWSSKHGVVHCSGAHTLDILQGAAHQGAAIGSFHPYQTFALVSSSEEAVQRFRGAGVAVEGDGWLAGFLENLAGRLDCRVVHVEARDRALYHASAVMSCGHLAGLAKVIVDMWGEMGVSEEEALPIIAPIMQSTLANIASGGVAASLTGPVVRGDGGTLGRHLDALEERLPDLAPLYRTLARQSLLAIASEPSSGMAEDLAGLLDDP